MGLHRKMRKLFTYLKKIIGYNLHFSRILLHFSQQMFFWEHLGIYHHLKAIQIKTLCIYKNKNEGLFIVFLLKLLKTLKSKGDEEGYSCYVWALYLGLWVGSKSPHR